MANCPARDRPADPVVGEVPLNLALSNLPYICYNSKQRFLWEGHFMKSFIIACVAAVVIAVLGGVVLNSIQEPADKAFSTTGVRLGA